MYMYNYIGYQKTNMKMVDISLAIVYHEDIQSEKHLTIE